MPKLHDLHYQIKYRPENDALYGFCQLDSKHDDRVFDAARIPEILLIQIAIRVDAYKITR